MTNQTLARETEWRIDTASGLFAPDRALNRPQPLRGRAFHAPVADYFWKYEGGAANQFFVWSITLTLAAWMVLAFGRILVASVLVNAFIGIVATIAWAKQQAMDMVLHAYDIVFYLSSRSTIGYLWNDFRTYVVALMAALLATAIAGAVAYRFDATRVHRRSAFIAIILLTLVSGVAALLKDERRHTQYYWDDLHISSFYSSWAETLETLWRGQLIEAANSAPGPQFAMPTDCAVGAKPPHIIVIHEESVVPPGYFQTLR
jgi:hypothetical protein